MRHGSLSRRNRPHAGAQIGDMAIDRRDALACFSQRQSLKPWAEKSGGGQPLHPLAGRRRAKECAIMRSRFGPWHTYRHSRQGTWVRSEKLVEYATTIVIDSSSHCPYAVFIGVFALGDISPDVEFRWADGLKERPSPRSRLPRACWAFRSRTGSRRNRAWMAQSTTSSCFLKTTPLPSPPR